MTRVEGIVAWAQRGMPALGMPGAMGIRLGRADDAYLAFVSAGEMRTSNVIALGTDDELGAPAPAPVAARPAPPPPPSRAPVASASATPSYGTPRIASQPPPVRPGAPAPVPHVAAPPPGAHVAAPPPSHVSTPPPAWSSAPPPLRVATPSSPGIAPLDPVQQPHVPLLPRMPRFREKLPLHFGQTTSLGAMGQTVDVSMTGIGLKTPLALQAGSRLFLALTLPDGRIAKSAGIVVWTKGDTGDAELGVRLTNVDGFYTQLIQQFVKKPRSA